MRFPRQQGSGSISCLFALSSFERSDAAQNSLRVAVEFHHDLGCSRSVFQTLKANPEVRRRDGEPEVSLRKQRAKHVQKTDVRHHFYLISLEFARWGSYSFG